MLDREPTSEEVAEAVRRAGMDSFLSDIEDLAGRFRIYRDRQVSPDLFLAIVQVPSHLHPYLRLHPPVPLNFKTKQVIEFRVAPIIPSETFWYSGDEALLNVFLDLAREAFQICREINPSIREFFANWDNTEEDLALTLGLIQDIDKLESQVWLLWLRDNFGGPGSTDCLRTRWGPGVPHRTPYHPGEFERWKTNSNHPGTELSDEVNVAVFLPNLFALSAKALSLLKDHLVRDEDEYRSSLSEQVAASELVSARPTQPIRLNDNDERDAFIFEQRTKGVKYREIIDQISQRQEWHHLDSEQAASAALRRYCKRTCRIPPPGNPPGRPPKTQQ